MLGNRPDDPPPPNPYLCGATVSTSTTWVIPMGSAYVVTDEYGWRTHPVRGGRDLHSGIDIATPTTQRPATVLAAASGRVRGVTNLGDRSYGLYVDIDHGQVTYAGTTVTLVTRYAHLASTTVQVGDTVTAGQPIAVEGASGGVTGRHLHFETLIDDKPVNPRTSMKTLAGLAFTGQPGKRQPGTGPAAGAAGLLADPQGVDQTSLLAPDAHDNAATIIRVGQQRGIPARGWLVALVTALQESALRNLAHGDRDSLGLFQQRPSMGWGAPQQLLDPVYATNRFYDSLVDVHGWDRMTLAQAAQAVQRSGHPGAYAKWEATAAALVGTIAGNTCGESDTSGRLPGNTIGEQAYNAALSQVGVPYSWGGGGASGPSNGICCSPSGADARAVIGFDCSGLTQYAWAQAGLTLPRSSHAQARYPRVTGDIQAGDLLIFAGGSHIGIADGHGGMIHAPRTGKSVEHLTDIDANPYYRSNFMYAVRPTGTPAA
ncbi:peptidoglycan DD-metalloendopeptidase family protein [Microlunatus sp. Y2014]|uniref:peptidoglycan DD-metalloendopeptidase family protein n=1 Tax=Microlunatus sp. Y2014 TaxID=3418488 RepID=UPI003DA786EF